MADGITCDVVRDGVGARVQVAGEVDIATAPTLLETLSGIDGKTMTIDLSEVPFMDSTGLHVLVRTQKRMREHGGWVELTGLQPPIRRLFAVTGLDMFFELA